MLKIEDMDKGRTMSMDSEADGMAPEPAARRIFEVNTVFRKD